MKYLLSLIFIISTLFTNAQSFWSDVNENAMITPRSAVEAHVPQEHRSISIEFKEMAAYLKNAPREHQNTHGIMFDLPMPDGSMESFEVFSSSIMEAPLAKKYPSIKSYKAISLNHPTWNARFDQSIWGFNASIKTSKGNIYIQPMHTETQNYHYSYYVNDYSDSELDMSDFICGTDESEIQHRAQDNTSINLREKCDPWPLREFRLALACTGEWGGNSALGGGTKEKALAKMNSSINRVNQIYENEVGIRLILIANNDAVIFTKPNGDPYHSADQGGVLLSQNTNILNQTVFFNSYDIGHIFTARCTDVGGIAALASVCQQRKGAGVTCWYTSSVEYVSVNIVCHEMGHQFAAPHTFNNCNGNESGATAFEPGGGSTIMSYSGLCGSQSYVRQADAYFHTNSLFNISTFTREIGANECGNNADHGNTRPEVKIPYEDGFYIPILTPFELDGGGSDCEDDPLTFCWEQYDLGRSINIGNAIPADGDVPLFRTFPATKSTKRIFPSLTHILHNNNNSPIVDKSEVLPYYDRNLSFALTVRDNHPMAGASNWDFVKFKVSSKAGPFEALTPGRNETIDGGTYYLVTWDVANTDQEPVNCKEIDIIMYKNGDYEDPIVLKSNTNNDGSEYILFPNEEIKRARIKIKASHNIFFDITNDDFKVNYSDDPVSSVAVYPNYRFVCTPDKIDINIKSTASSNANETIKIIEVENVPAAVVASVSKTEFSTGEDAIISLDFSDYHTNGIFEINVKYQIGDGDTLYLTPIKIETFKNDFYNLALVGPIDTKGGSPGPTFEWIADEDAETYTLELATNPSFKAPYIVQRREGLTKTNLRLPLLDVNTIYYWRVRGENICGLSEWTETSVISTIAQSCSINTILDKNLIISSRKTNSYKLNVPQSVSLSDVNVSNIKVTVNTVDRMTLKLVSPAGTEVILWDQECYPSGLLDIGFDDEAPRTPICPPQDKNVYQPLNDSLSRFIGEDAQGTWLLKADLTQFTDAGRLLDLSMEFCGDISITPPELITNDTLKTPPNNANTISLSYLMADDANSENNNLLYTLTSVPNNGVLLHYGTELKVGDQFLQGAIGDWNLEYRQSGNHNGEDDFKFIVSDEEGGWTGLHTFNILIDDKYVVKTHDLTGDAAKIFITPNPASDMITVHPIDLDNEIYSFSIFNTSGQVVYKSNSNFEQNGYKINVSGFSNGLYYLNVQNSHISTIKKLLIQR